MFKILLVEDETYKIKVVYQILDKVIGLNLKSVVDVMDANAAKKLMKENHYDLLILDIAIPLKKTLDPDPMGGIKLLEEVLERDVYKIPTHIIGLSAKSESFKEASEKFDKDILTIIKFEESSDEWHSTLLSGIQHKVSSKERQINAKQDYNYDVAIICALQEELEANLDNGWKWKVVDCIPHDDTIYHETKIINSENEELKIIAAHAFRMGIPATTTLATKVIANFRPKFIIMTGIMAGVSGKTKLGDTILGNPIWDWGSGKWTTEADTKDAEQSNSVFQIEPFQYKPDTTIVKYANLLDKDKVYFFNLRNDFKGKKPDYDIKLHSGPIASGASVLANKEKFNDILGQNRKLLGIEMEGYGLMCAADSMSHPKPTALCIKTVVDYGDTDKADDFHQFGCHASAKIAQKLIEDFLIITN